MRRISFGIFLSLVAALALVSGFRPFYLLLYGLLSYLTLAILWAFIQTKGLTVEVSRIGASPHVGRPLFFRLSVRNRMTMPRWGLRFRLSGQGVSTTESVLDVPLGKRITWSEIVEPMHRGHGTLGELTAVTRDPLGLVQVERKLSTAHNVLIYPRTVPLPAGAAPGYGGVGEEGQINRRQRESLSASGVRDYAAGDSLTRIHWQTTARMGRFMTKEFDTGGEREHVWIILDLYVASQAGNSVASTEETGITIAASITRMLGEGGKSVGLIAHGKESFYIAPSQNPEYIEEIMTSLALAKAQGPTPLSVLLAGNDQSVDQGSAVVLIAPWPGQDLSGIATRLYRRGVRLIPVLLDVATFGQRHDARWLKDPRTEFPGGAFLIRRNDDLSESLVYVMDRLDDS